MPRPTDPSGDVASALLVRLTRHELARQGVLPGSPAPDATPRGPATLGEAHVPLDSKRALLDAVALRHGLTPLLRVGAGLDRAQQETPDDPILTVLLNAADPADAIVRWQRLERFLHSRHRLTRLPHAAPANRQAIAVRHVGPPGAPPTAAEDALILGVLVALCRRTAGAGLQVEIVTADGALHQLPPSLEAPLAVDWSVPGAFATWRFSWDQRATPLLTPPAAAGTADTSGTLPVARQLARVIAHDLVAPWTLATAAAALAAQGGPSLSPRSLQRRLAGEAAAFPGVVRSARVAAAGRLLAEDRLSVGVIGFVCGFTDQPHFTRQFRRQTGLTPAAYRAAFGAATQPSRMRR